MKTIVSLICFVTYLSVCSFSTYESIEPILLFSVSNKKIVRVGVVNNLDKTIQLFIVNKKNERFFERSIKVDESYFEFHDLSALPKGNYKIKIFRGSFQLSREFDILEKEIIIKSKNTNQTTRNEH